MTGNSLQPSPILFNPLVNVGHEIVMPILRMNHRHLHHDILLQLLLRLGNQPFQLLHLVLRTLQPNLALQLLVATLLQLLLILSLQPHSVPKNEREFLLLLLYRFHAALLFPPNHIPVDMNTSSLIESLCGLAFPASWLLQHIH